MFISSACLNVDADEWKLILMPKEIIQALGYQKKSSALANLELKQINSQIGNAIIKACNQIINLNLIEEFPLSI